jgi:hypothetical protein
MAGPRLLREADVHASRAWDHAQQLSAGPAREAAHAAVLRARVPTLIAAGALAEAAEVAHASRAAATEPLAWAEAQLRLAQATFARGGLAEAVRAAEDAEEAGEPPRWLRGWMLRVRANAALAAGGPAEGAEAWAAAWRANQGFRFQQDLLLARIAEAERRWDEALVQRGGPLEAVAAEASRRLAALHGERLGAPPNCCARCARASLAARASCAFGVADGRIAAFWST